MRTSSKLAITLGIIGALGLAAGFTFQKTLENSSACVISGRPAVDGKSVTLVSEISPDIKAPSCGCCMSNDLGNAGAMGPATLISYLVGFTFPIAAGVIVVARGAASRIEKVAQPGIA